MKRIVPAIAALVLLTAACSGSPKPSPNVAGVLPRSTAPRLTITPGDGSHAVRPDTRIVVRTDHGTLSQATVTSNGHAVAGEFSTDRSSWQASWTLAPGAAYQVTATASGGGRDTTATSGFKVAAARTGLKITDVVPNRGETVGVGLPVIVTFDRRVPDSDKAAVEHSFEVRSTQWHEGAWNWLWNTQTGTQQAIFRLNGFWQPHEKVSFTAHLAGVKVSTGFGTADATHSFTVGDDHQVTVSDMTHHLVAKSNGRMVRQWDVSMGDRAHPTWITYSGTYLTMGNFRSVHMTSAWMGVVDPKSADFYDTTVPWAVQITDTGEYIHSNEGDDPSCLGNRNCSHGCVRSEPAAAQWFEGWAYRGDVVTIKGTRRQLDWSNGWGFYQKSWDDWKKGSAAGAPVTTSAPPT